MLQADRDPVPTAALRADVALLRRSVRRAEVFLVGAALAVAAFHLAPAARAVADSVIFYTKNLAGTSDLPRLIIPTDDDTVVCRFENSHVDLVTGGLRTAGTERLTNAGALTSISSLNSVTTSATAFTFPGAGTLSSTTTGAMTADSGTTGDVNFGVGGSAKTVNIATGTGGNTVGIGATDVTADTITIGSLLDSTTMAGDFVNQRVLYVKQGTTITSPDAFALMGEMTLGPFTPTGTDPVVIIFTATVDAESSSAADGEFRIMVDGVEKILGRENTTSIVDGDGQCVTLTYMEVLSAAPHTVTVEWRDDDSTAGRSVACKAGVAGTENSASLLVMQLKD